MRAAARDVRFAVRLLLWSPGVTAIAVICLALGMGTTAVFTIVDAVAFRPLAYLQPERLVRIYTEFPTFPNGGLLRFAVSPPEFVEMRETLHAYDYVDAWQVGAVNLITAKEPMWVTASFVSGTLFDSLGIRPQQGRWINRDDDREGAPLVILISHGLWRGAFGGAGGIIGRQTKLDGLSATVVGVMPAGFQYPPGQVDVSDVWVPLQLTAADLKRRGNHRLAVLAKLQRNVSLAQGRQELATQTKS